jgi:hypothetical protein
LIAVMMTMEPAATSCPALMLQAPHGIASVTRIRSVPSAGTK